MVPLLMSDYEGRHSGTRCMVSESLFVSNAGLMKVAYQAATTAGRQGCGLESTSGRDRTFCMIAARLASRFDTLER